mgnify:CR=1 FL=1
MRPLYLDYNATTPVDEEVCQAMLPYFTRHFGNPSSSHLLGKAALAAVEDARTRVADLLGAERDEIVFTAGGTESNNLAILGTMLLTPASPRRHLVVSALEHPAVLEPARRLETLGCSVTIVPCTPEGLVDPAAVEAAISVDTALVSIMHANNEVGTIQSIREIAAVCRRHGVPLHTDAAQSAGKISTLVDQLQVDLLTIAGHKLYAPKGIGALYVRGGTALDPVLFGAGHERGLRPGTENVPYIVGLGKAAEIARQLQPAAAERQAGLRDRLQALLLGAIDDLIIHGETAPRLPNTLCVSFPEIEGRELLARVPELCASTGSACHSAAPHAAGTLAAMGVPMPIARGAVRLSLGRPTTREEVDRAAELLIGAWESLTV